MEYHLIEKVRNILNEIFEQLTKCLKTAFNKSNRCKKISQFFGIDLQNSKYYDLFFNFDESTSFAIRNKINL